MKRPVFVSISMAGNKKRKSCVIFLLCIFLLSLASCMKDSGNRPYEPDGPAPDPHDGVFVYENSSMAFGGDGKKIVLSLKGDLCALFELEEGDYEGTYVFLSGDLPPLGSKPVRYDAAHELKIELADGYSVVFPVGLVSQDGKSVSVSTETVKEDRIPLVFEKDGKYIQIMFVKE